MRKAAESFFNFYHQGFVRLAVGVPLVKVADPQGNAREILALWREAKELHCALVVFPELGLSAYSCEDLFHQEALLEETRSALRFLAEQSRDWMTVGIIGVPLVIDQTLFNCAAVLSQGRILGLIPKTYLPGIL
jgi:NAD+ synthase (glutamine-hydrolysing)